MVFGQPKKDKETGCSHIDQRLQDSLLSDPFQLERGGAIVWSQLELDKKWAKQRNKFLVLVPGLRSAFDAVRLEERELTEQAIKVLLYDTATKAFKFWQFSMN